MIGIYFSGTGNTKYCIEKFMENYDSSGAIYPLEKTSRAIEEIEKHQEIIFAYPIYYSNLPKIVKDFIEQNASSWQNKKIFIIATMGLFSGDGTGVAARLFQRHGANILGGVHIKMPDCICDVKALKRSIGENKKIVIKANHKLKKAAEQLKMGAPTREGLGSLYHLAGLFGQRLWFYNKTQKYSDKLRIDTDVCIRCKQCIQTCPMHALSLYEGRVRCNGKCTMCYRCINQCPQKAITLLGDKVLVQYSISDFK